MTWLNCFSSLGKIDWKETPSSSLTVYDVRQILSVVKQRTDFNKKSETINGRLHSTFFVEGQHWTFSSFLLCLCCLRVLPVSFRPEAFLSKFEFTIVWTPTKSNLVNLPLAFNGKLFYILFDDDDSKVWSPKFSHRTFLHFWIHFWGHWQLPVCHGVTGGHTIEPALNIRPPSSDRLVDLRTEPP